MQGYPWPPTLGKGAVLNGQDAWDLPMGGGFTITLLTASEQQHLTSRGIAVIRSVRISFSQPHVVGPIVNSFYT